MTENKIKLNKTKIPQYKLYKFSTFKFFTDKENELYNNIQKATNIEAKNKAKESLQSEIINFSGIRTIKDKNLYYKNQVFWFKNDLLDLFINDNTKEKSLIEDVIIITVKHDEIFEQIMDNGFFCKNKHYSFFTSGAGQQRKEVLTFVSTEALEKYNDYLMGGLTNEKINNNGGINTGKLLSYEALTMSAGTPVEISYDRVIVVDDFETIVEKKVQYIDTEDKDLPIIREIKKVPINHMDGAGMILPNKVEGVSGNWQFRNKWCKGALVEFNFLKFANDIAKNTKIKDIYNVEHDIEKEDIWIILTRSQFKMAKFYQDWNTFKAEMQRISSKFIICNIENPPQKMKELSYQYLQTLDIPPEDTDTIKNLCQPTIDYIKELHEDKDEALKALGAIEDNKNLKPLQEALLIYPELLHDEHVKTQIKNVVTSIRDDAKGGRILSPGYYSYIFPDVYAFCQRLFEGTQEPEGLIPEGYVYNAYHKDNNIKTVDLMRSPHLHPSEHCVRELIKDEKCKSWFCGNATYVSIHDLAQLQMKNDVDGDICYIATSLDLINNIRDCLPVYYKMFKAEPQEINISNIKETLRNAFKANQIGYISNALTKYLSKSYDKDFELDMNFIARLQAWNNFTIDFPKTGRNIELPKKDKELYESLLTEKSPHFFRWAKNKSKTAVNPYGNGIVDRISKYISENAKYYKYKYFTNEKFDYIKLNSGNEVNRSTKAYKRLQNLLFEAEKEIRHLNAKLSEMKKKETQDDDLLTKYDITYQYYRDKMIDLFNGDINKCVDYLIDIEYCQEYRKNKSRNILWNCFGWELLKNINENLQSNRELKAKVRFAYRTNKQRIEELKRQLEDKIKPISININEAEYAKINSFSSENEKKLFYVLICLSKLNKKNEIKIKGNSKSKKNKIQNIDKLNKLADITNAAYILKKFEKENLINKQKGTVDIIRIIGFEKKQEGICFLVDNVWRPLVSLAKYEGKAIGKCRICEKEFIKIGNAETCGKICSDELRRRNKQKKYQEKKNSA